MSNLAHTPGPWIVRRLNTGLWIASAETLNPIARMRTAASCSEAAQARRVPDARLMAAAPDFLRVAQLLVEANCAEAVAIATQWAHAAIAKTTGA